jgi:hypothetical protein
VRAHRSFGALFAGLTALAFGACEMAQNMENTSEYQTVGNLVHKVPGVSGSSDLAVHAVRSSKTVIVHKIAIMPLIEDPDKVDGAMGQGAGEAVTAEVYARATIVGGWNVLPQDDVERALQDMPPTTAADMDQDALALGKKLVVDGVLYGAVNRYRERVGYDFAAQSPAAVSVTLNFVDEKSGQIVWTATYSKEQKALTEDVFDLPNFIHNTGRWVRAHDLAAQGVQKAIISLQDKVTIEPLVQGQY